MCSYEKYKELLSKTYSEAVEYLLEKYGPAEDDYLREKSYNRFLNNEIKSIGKGKYTRTSEGLYCHHIDEDKYENLSDESYIRHYKYSFDLQKKDRLVYCDLFEHAILHALIAKETSLTFGINGYKEFIERFIRDWYIDNNIPKMNWMKNCYDKAYMEPEDTLNLLRELDKTIEMGII